MAQLKGACLRLPYLGCPLGEVSQVLWGSGAVTVTPGHPMISSLAPLSPGICEMPHRDLFGAQSWVYKGGNYE